MSQPFFNINSDLVVCENGTVWGTSYINEPTNFAKPFQDKRITINFVHILPDSIMEWCTFGGPTGLWSNLQLHGFEECEIPRFYSWIGKKDFKNCELEWFGIDNHRANYFNAKGNVYALTKVEPFYELVWENRQLIQLTGGIEDNTYCGCLLDNGEVWVQDSPTIELELFDWESTVGDWIHLYFYDDKKVKNILATDSIIYVLCESPEQKLIFHSRLKVPKRKESDEEESDEEDDIYFVEDKSINLTILKVVCVSEIILCWCKEGLYAWVIDKYCPDTKRHPVFKYPEQFYPYKFFENKKILDIGTSLHFYILCDDGVYTIPSKVKKNEKGPIIPIKLPLFDENIPVMFSSYFKQKYKLGKSARSRIDTEEQSTAKKQKLDHKEEKPDD